ncbi:MAG: YCF48-related protein, partial [Cryomorphaceae bacterium]
MNKVLPFLSIAVLLTISASCKKAAFDIPLERIDLPVDADARCLYIHGDSIFVAGGNVDQTGFIAGSALDELSFQLQRSDLKRELYSFAYHKERWYAGGDSLLVYRGRELSSMPQYYWNRADWVSDLSNHPIRDMAQDSTGILMVAGRKLAFGVLYQSFDDGGSWSPLEPENELRCAAIQDGLAWVAGNGILMRSQWGSGAWERLALNDRYITDLHFESASDGWALIEDGHVLQTSDGGTTWQEVRKKGGMSFMYRMATEGASILCVGEAGMLSYTTNEGMDWKS